MMKTITAGFILAALCLGACTTAPVASSGAAPRAAADLANDRAIGTLTPRKLAAGECGMFLWAKTAERNLVFFNTRGGDGQMMLSGRETKLTRIAADGAEVLGQFETQTFKHEDMSIELQIQFEQRPGLARGAVIPQGALRLKRDDGWELFVPVGGLVGCEET